MSIDTEDQALQEWLTTIAIDCQCCGSCWDRPCGACQQGAPCDQMRCRCWDEEDDDAKWSDEDEE